MNTAEDQAGSGIAVERVPLLPDSLILVMPHDQMASQSVEVRQSNRATTIPSRFAAKWVHRFTREVHGCRFVTFPLAPTAFMVLAAGLIAIGLGVVVKNGRLVMEGLFLALVGCSFYGCRLFDD